MSLVILAAGLGKRFGGGKQLVAVGKTGKPLMYFSVMDAWRAGIRRLVLVVSAGLHADIKARFLPLLPEDLYTVLVEQRPDDLPDGCRAEAREKPWGTAHALWCARKAVSGACIVTNADDYYGPGSYSRLADHFTTHDDWALVSFPLENTLSEHGTVNRGLCEIREGCLGGVRECLSISFKEGGIRGELGGQGVWLDAATPVSMNIWGFGSDVFAFLEAGLLRFFSESRNHADGECYLPDLVMAAIGTGGRQVRVYASDEQWYGMTYREDLDGLGRVFEAHG